MPQVSECYHLAACYENGILPIDLLTILPLIPYTSPLAAAFFLGFGKNTSDSLKKNVTTLELCSYLVNKYLFVRYIVLFSNLYFLDG